MRTLVSISAIVLASTVATLTGCGDRGAVDDPEAAVRDSAGVRIVVLADHASTGSRIVEPEGDWPAAQDLSFGDLLDVHVTWDGSVVLLDGMTGQVTVLSSEGVITSQFGRLGEGPGEFSPFGLFNVASTDSTILIPDIQLQRISEFRMSGELLGTHRMLDPSRGSSVGYAVDWRSHPEGGLAARILSEFGDAIVRLHEGVLDTLHAEPISGRERSPILAPMLVWDLDAGGRIVVARSDRWEVRLWDPVPGEMEWIVRRPESERPLAEGHREHLGDLFISMIEEERGGRVAEGQRAGILASINFPIHAPVISAVFSSAGGEYWVQGAQLIEDMGRGAMRVGTPALVGSTDWWVLREDGSFKERVTLPEGFIPRQFKGPWVYGISEDGLGVQRVTRIALDN